MSTEFSEIAKPKYTVYKNNDLDLHKLSEKILNREVVIFPTETVYGIGANALDPIAVEKIYRIKNRPKNNPLIVHCMGKYDALLLAETDEYHTYWFSKLTDEFWPGPLTIIIKSGSIVPDIVKANTNYVGLRSPNNSAIQKLIQYSGVPIAAPSANISGRTSSTCLNHVYKYFTTEKINIIDDENYICKHGIESTIVLLDNRCIKILRPGFITKTNIIGLFDKIKESNSKFECPKFIEGSNLKNSCQNISPGQLDSHYCPEKPTYILSVINFGPIIKLGKHLNELRSKTFNYLYKSALIDFNGLAKKYSDKFMAYVDLSYSGDFNEAMFNLYNVFHELDKLDCDKIFIFDFSFIKNDLNVAIWNRIKKAASGKQLAIPMEIF